MFGSCEPPGGLAAVQVFLNAALTRMADPRMLLMDKDIVPFIEQECPIDTECKLYNSMGESNTVVSAYTLYRHLQQYCSHLSKCLSLCLYVCLSVCLTDFQTVKVRFTD